MSHAISSHEPADAPTRRTSEVELALPVSDPLSERDAPAADAPEPRHAPRLPEYKVHPHETLRSIARDTLRDSRRASEILELNQDVIDDPNYLTPGQIIVLPEDARLRRRIR
jgi:nucleoid-associated protein YgaU